MPLQRTGLPALPRETLRGEYLRFPGPSPGSEDMGLCLPTQLFTELCLSGIWECKGRGILSRQAVRRGWTA